MLDNNLANFTKGTLQPVRIYPDTILKEKCLEVQQIDREVRQTAADLIKTMTSLTRCVGLAAPQIGVKLRIVVVDVSMHPKAAPESHGLLCMINPVIVSRSGARVWREGCVSLPDFTADVSRAEHIAIDYVDLDGKLCAIEARGFESVALQHEIDHLDGLLFLDRVAPHAIYRRKRMPFRIAG